MPLRRELITACEGAAQDLFSVEGGYLQVLRENFLNFWHRPAPASLAHTTSQSVMN
jgi:hypothetical protein